MSSTVRARRFLGIVTGFMFFLLMEGCLTAPVIERTSYYSLNPKFCLDKQPKLEYTLGMRPLLNSKTYGLPMAYLDNTFQIGYRSHEEWADQPAHMVTRALQDAISDSDRFSDVGNAADMARPDILLTGELRAFHENRTLSPPAAEIVVRIEMRPSISKGALWAETLSETEPIASSNPLDVAHAMNIALERLAHKAASVISTLEMPPKEEFFDIRPLRKTP